MNSEYNNNYIFSKHLKRKVEFSISSLIINHMGITHKIYAIEPKLSLDEITNISRRVYNNATKGPSQYYCSFRLTDQSYFYEVEKRFPVKVPEEFRSFNIEVPNSNELNKIIQSDEIYERYTTYSHENHKTQSNYLAYSIDIYKDLKELNLLFHLPQDNDECKLKRIKEVIGKLNSDGILSMREEEFNLIFPSFLVLNNADRKFGTWSYTNRFTIEAGSKFVRLRFNSRYFKSYNTQIHIMAQEINDSLSKITNGTDSYKGLIYTQDTKLFLTEIKRKEIIKLTTHISIDLKNYDEFNVQEVLQLGSSVEEVLVEIEGISWLFSELPHQNHNNTLSIRFKNDSYDLEIGIYKDESDETIAKIEQVIGHKLVFKEWL